LQHEVRNTPGCRVSAHLLIPGFVFTENRPALSRWHPDYAEAFAAFLEGG